VAKYLFLSDEWLSEAGRIRDEHQGPAPVPGHVIKMNQVITEAPFGDGTINAYLDTSSGEMVLGRGHLDDADLKVTLDYETAKAILVEGNPQAGLQAFMAGRIKVEGDMAKLMVLQSVAADPDPAAVEVARRIQAMTE
jgi:hypothetical protein